ncbi:glycosyltransferase family 4 protein [Methanolobus sp.]|uniref:glycosyltransferase family 4 protein n=1 Tax=Methanolobus sp. TaxID=1874737 RepID=UPI0025D98FC9|nr:glycosyltransferase family 4 protein [Methanolobus sp.]
MKIAIIAPSPVPFTIGGAELLLKGMEDAINKYSSHQCELIKLPTKEDSFWNLIESYYKFYQLDLSHFDMVISTKYPSWMVRHRNHILYMIHPLRGLYDTYSFSNQSQEIPDNLRIGLIKDIVDFIDKRGMGHEGVDDLFTMLFQLKENEKQYSKEAFHFPGPFIRKIIRFLDSCALSPDSIQKYFTMSRNVKNRSNYFPSNVQINVIHPPSKLNDFECKGYKYLFTASRLDGPKRIDLLIKAMKLVPHDIKLKIAGDGPLKQALIKLADGDKRIEFLGFVNESELIDHYSNALAILFVPFDEDYGYITIEGMMSAKAVITTSDSGGPLEFVSESETGFVVDPTPPEIAGAINYFVDNRTAAQEMGQLAKEKVRTISWVNFVHELLDESVVQYEEKKKILVLSTYSCYPPRGGGQHRSYHIYSRLAKKYDVTICSIIETNKTYENLILENGLRQICIPQSVEHAKYQWEVESKTGFNLYDIVMIDSIGKSDDYVSKVKGLCDVADIVIFSQPFLYSLKNFIDLNDKIVVYESQNVEYYLKKDYVGSQLSQKVLDIEKEISVQADIVFTTSSEDKDHLVHLYCIEDSKVFVAPNGVDTSVINMISQGHKQFLKKRTGLANKNVILFVGSWHPPNLEALKFIVDKLTRKNTNYIFVVIGSIKDYYLQKYHDFPENVLAFGVVDEDEKYELYKLADIALNPMFSGSGTNLKMLDYMSAGIPVVSTTVGARGLDVEDRKHALICDADNFNEKIIELIETEELQLKLRKNARELVETKYSWDKIAESIISKLQEIVEP